jgi:hypothetical protein
MQGPARLILTVASHRSRSRATADCAALSETRGDRAPGHTAVAVLQRRAGGVLGIDRYASTAKHLLWGGALLGGPLLVIRRSAGEELLTAVGLSGAGPVIAHLRRYLDPTLCRASETFTAQLPGADLAAELCPDVDGPWPDLALAAG